MKQLILLFTTALLVASCNSKEIYNHTYTINDAWTYADSLVFEYDIQDTLMPYNLTLEVKHSDEYPYENTYILASTVFPDGHRVTNPVSLELANAQGQWVGTCSSHLCKAEIAMANNAYFQSPGKYKLVLSQFSRIDSLKGIEALQFTITQSDVKK